MERVIFIPDAHVPYHHRLAWRTALAVVRGFKPDRIVILGDFADCFNASFHEKGERRKHSLKDELLEVEGCLDELEAAAPSATKNYVMGNHEYRISRYVSNRAPEFNGLIDYEDMVGLTKRGWRVTPYKKTLRLGKLNITHDLGKAGRQAARDAEAVFGGNAIIGHVHSMDVSVMGNAKGRPHVAASFGWLGGFEHADYMPLDRAYRNWVHGLGTAHIEKNGHAHIQAHPIFEGKACVDGVIYRGKVAKK